MYLDDRDRGTAALLLILSAVMIPAVTAAGAACGESIDWIPWTVAVAGADTVLVGYLYMQPLLIAIGLLVSGLGLTDIAGIADVFGWIT